MPIAAIYRHKINGLVYWDHFLRSRRSIQLSYGTGRDQPAKIPRKQVRLACTNRALIHEVEAIEVSF